MQPNTRSDQANESEAPVGPARERFWADHDQPWQYQPYHLSFYQKLALVKRRERMLAGEYGLESRS
ncbi:MAG: hypothetical protein HY329_16550 [Chloroflexi bacterium]|nr:hypothetical protein [Chloroflexota bacterium]